MRFTLYVFFLLSLLWSQNLSAQGIAVFFDPEYVDTVPGGEGDDTDDPCEAEGLVLAELLSSFGYAPVFINNIEDLGNPAVLNGISVLIFPEAEVSALGLELDEIATVQTFVNNGGKVILMNDPYLFIEIFDLNIDYAIIEVGVTTYPNPEHNANTCYDSLGIDELVGISATNLAEHSLPEGSLCHFKNQDGVSVGAVPYGSGWICYYGWDMYSCENEGGSAEDFQNWYNILECMLSGLPAPPPAPVPDMGFWALIILGLNTLILGAVANQHWQKSGLKAIKPI